MPKESPQHQSLPPGFRLEEYEIVRELGCGGFGITYVAMDLNLDREVVIKENLPIFACRDHATATVHPRSSAGEDAEMFRWSLDNFVQEAKTLAKFDHPNIVRVLRVFEANGTAYFVMPRVVGEPLDTVIKQRGPLGEAELRGILMPLLDALEELHEQRVYHRDIKPANVLLQSNGKPVLIDFGAARQQVSQKSLTVIESPGYTPQEQMQTRGNVGPWSDLYALAATLYRAITQESPPKAFDRVRRDPIRILAAEFSGQYSHAFLAAIDQALRFDEAERPQHCAQWRALLEQPAAAIASKQGGAPPPLPPVGDRANDVKGIRPPLPGSGGSVSKGGPSTSAIVVVASVVVLTMVAMAFVGWVMWPRHEQGINRDPLTMTPDKPNVIKPDAPEPERPSIPKKPEPAVPMPPDPTSPKPMPNVKPKAPEPEHSVPADPPAPKPFTPTVPKQPEPVMPKPSEPPKPMPKPEDPPANPPPLLKSTTPFLNSLKMQFVPLPGTHVLACIHETRSKDFAVFMAEINRGYEMTGTRAETWRTAKFEGQPVGRGKGELAQDSAHPVCNVSYVDAEAFCIWLTRHERELKLIGRLDEYRLPTDAEWSLMIGLGEEKGSTPEEKFKNASLPLAFPWGGSFPPTGRAGNYADKTAHDAGTDGGSYISKYVDGFATTAPVMSFDSNSFGIYDLGGNVWEWCKDSFDGGSTDRRVLRGASWFANPGDKTSSAGRIGDHPVLRTDFIGFRCVLAVAGD